MPHSNRVVWISACLLLVAAVCVVLAAPALHPELGLLDMTANGGINPATGNPWEQGDTYRFAFCSSAGTTAVSSVISDYNKFVQDLANASPLGIGAAEGFTWKVIASTPTVAARDNASLYATGTNTSIWLINGTTVVADNYVDLYGFDTMNNAINKSETGGTPLKHGSYSDVWTGTNQDGTRRSGEELGSGGTIRCGLITNNDRHWIVRFDVVPTDICPLYAISQVLEIKGPAGMVLILR